MTNTPPMNRRSILQTIGIGSLGASLGLPGSVSAEAMAVSPDVAETKDDSIENLSRDTINALEGAYGRHSGLRRNHTKGVGALGYFIGSAEGARYSRSTLFSGQKVEVVARFSLAGGDPEASDKERSPRGVGLEFRLPHGELHHMTMLHTPMFFAALPQTFLDKFVALKREPETGKSDPALLQRFFATHHDSDAQLAYLKKFGPPPSYANAAYFGIHTFRFINKEGQETMVRFRFEPRDGRKFLDDAALAKESDDFLIPGLFERVKRGPIEWDFKVTVGAPGDSVDDPTVLWPEGRHEFHAGRLVLDHVTPDPRAGSYRINYDPLMLSDGIAASNDPILLFRSPTYASSHERRLREG